MIEHIGIILNSISVVCLGFALKKVRDKTIVDQCWEEREKKRWEQQNRVIRTLQSTTDEIKEDLKNMRLEITGVAPRTELNSCEFEKRFGRWIVFDDATKLPEDLANYAAKIGLKAIASELPKEKRTHEIIKYIVGRMEEELGKKEMIL